MKVSNRLITTNRFRYYRHEIPGIIVRRMFSTNPVPLRVNQNEEGWDDVTKICKYTDLPEVNQLRLKPFLGEVTEEEYLENSKGIDFRDCIVSQDWAKNPGDSVKLLQSLGTTESFPHKKIGEDFFMSVFITELYYSHSKGNLTLDDVESFELAFVFHRQIPENGIELQMVNVKFKDPKDVSLALRDDDHYRDPVFITPSLYMYYFYEYDIAKILSQEYLLTPAMVLDHKLYEKIKDKITTINYESAVYF